MKLRSTLLLILIIAVVGAFVYIGLFGISIGKYNVNRLQDQVSLGLDLTGGAYVVYEADNAKDVENLSDKIQGTMTVFRNRLDARGFTEATIVAQGDDRIRVEVPFNSESGEGADPQMISEILGKVAVLEFIGPDGEVILSGDDVISAKVALDENSQPVVAFELTNDATSVFAKATAEFLNQPISIYIDSILISAPTVNSVINTGSGIIEGGFTAEEASNLAIQIESGALPLAIHEIEQRSISASLGVDALSKSIFAGGIGVALLFLFMLIYYRVPGIVADIALIFYMFIMLILLAGIKGIQLTLPGIAGIILSIGMAVDANVIIFERFKEELRLGKTLRTSLNSGYHKAMQTIIDSNITTIIAAIVLMVFGKGAIKSFAYTLTMGIVVSMFTALFVTRWLLRLFMNMGIKNKALYGAGRIKE